MKLSYFGYYLENLKKQELYHFNFQPVIHQFSLIKDREYKNSFRSATDELTYLFPVRKNIYLYVMTKSHEIIKKIDTEKIDVDEIYSKLDANDKLGFASYVYFSDCYYGLASTIQGPRNRSFVDFINKVLTSLGHGDYVFKTKAFMHQSSRADALSLDFVGKSILQVGKGNALFQYLAEFAGLGSGDVDSFVVEIKPRRNRSIKKEMLNLNAKINDEGLLKYIVRAKEDGQEGLEDFYIASQGGVADSINSRTDKDIYDEMIKKIDANRTLSDKITEFRNDEGYSKENIPSLTAFGKPDTWNSHLSGL